MDIFCCVCMGGFFVCLFVISVYVVFCLFFFFVVVVFVRAEKDREITGGGYSQPDRDKVRKIRKRR